MSDFSKTFWCEDKHQSYPSTQMTHILEDLSAGQPRKKEAIYLGSTYLHHILYIFQKSQRNP